MSCFGVASVAAADGLQCDQRELVSGLRHRRILHHTVAGEDGGRRGGRVPHLFGRRRGTPHLPDPCHRPLPGGTRGGLRGEGAQWHPAQDNRSVARKAKARVNCAAFTVLQQNVVFVWLTVLLGQRL